MSCKSGLFSVNTTSGTTIASGGTYIPTTIIRRFGKNCQLAGTGVNLSGAGYYDVNFVANVTATAASTITASLYQDGHAVPGATVTATAGAIGDVVALPISALVRLGCNCESSSLTCVISGQSVTTNNLTFVVEKI